MDEILNRILRLIEGSGTKKKDFLTALGLSRSALSGWTSGNNDSYKKYLPEIAAYFHVSLDWLAGTTPQEHFAEKHEPTELERILEQQPGLMFHGAPLTEDDRAKLITAMRAVMAVEDKKHKK